MPPGQPPFEQQRPGAPEKRADWWTGLGGEIPSIIFSAREAGGQSRLSSPEATRWAAYRSAPPPLPGFDIAAVRPRSVGGSTGSADWHWRSEVYKYKDTNIPKDPSDMPSQPLHPQGSSRIARACRALLRRLGFSARWTRRDGYRPERHYMRGPGPKTRSLQSDCEQRPHTE